MTLELAGYQRRALRAAAHALDPVVHVGAQGVSETVLKSVDEALTAHELIKMRFVDHKDEKKTIAADVAAKLDAVVAGTVGHVAILYRPHPEESKRRIVVPQRDDSEPA